MGVASPIWLWGLLGLMVPVAIHLLSRKDMRVIRVGSLRHLEHATTRQAIRIHLNAYLLLALRCLIVALVAMLLAGLYLANQASTTRWVLVEGNLGKKDLWRSVIDSLEEQGYEARRLQQGFPLVAEKNEDPSSPDYWALAEQLSNIQLDRCVVISEDRLAGFAGARPARNTRLTWLTARPDSARFVLLAVQAGDSVALRLGRSDEISTSFETLRLPSSQARAAMPAEDQPGAEATNMPPIRVVLSGTKIADEERRVVSAAIRAIGSNGIVPIQVKEVPPDGIVEGEWLIWLSADAPPARGIANVIRKSPDLVATAVPTTSNTREGPLLVRAADGGVEPKEDNRGAKPAVGSVTTALERCWIITQTLTPSSAVRSQFTLQLATLLLGNATQQLNRATERHDRRLLPEGEIFSTQEASAISNNTSVKDKRSAGDMLAIALVALLAVERLIANRQQL
ncbi:MAG TPA: BatA domain-containing protein [Chryseolinea sp.]|nr:BatA domain-containing protein [Chryseolinea sp.]